LILNNIPLVKNFAGRGQALDFSGDMRQGRPSFNKVIHKGGSARTKHCQIKDLGSIREARLKL
jgi:hypothetical protein